MSADSTLQERSAFMFGCHLGKLFQVTVSGGSYQEALSAVVHGVTPGIAVTEQDIYGDLLLRKPGADELSSPRKEPDLPVIITGLNVADTVPGAGNTNHTNGTPLTIVIPNLDRHDIHIQQYQDTNRTPRPGHASYASFQKYGPSDDAIGAGFFSGRYSATIVAAGCIAKSILQTCGIRIASFVREIAGVRCGDIDYAALMHHSENYRRMRRDYDPFYQEIYVKQRITMGMRFLQKAAVLAEVEAEIDAIRQRAPKMVKEAILDTYGVHPVVLCPDIEAADAMVDACTTIYEEGDTAGGLIELVIQGAPVGLGEPVFEKLDGELARMMGIGAVKGVEIGAGFGVKDMTGYECNDRMRGENGAVVFDSNNAGGITGGLATGQDIIVRLAVKPTPTIDKKQHTIDKYTLQTTELSAITRRDPTITNRIWPVAEAYAAIVLLDQLTAHYGYQSLRAIVDKSNQR
ncbi:MAG: chorismate synthase [Chitinivibrionales bacterium]|nr:chorismate synthase [Chitinivibrionales bacterium]MBD3394872.1 chorismate synthase [Chitinivibrionales bacterium]